MGDGRPGGGPATVRPPVARPLHRHLNDGAAARPPSSPPRTAFAGAGSDHPAHPGHSLLRHRPFALLCGEQIASSVGRQVATLALALLAVTRLDAGPFGASALMALSYLPERSWARSPVCWSTGHVCAA